MKREPWGGVQICPFRSVAGVPPCPWPAWSSASPPYATTTRAHRAIRRRRDLVLDGDEDLDMSGTAARAQVGGRAPGSARHRPCMPRRRSRCSTSLGLGTTEPVDQVVGLALDTATDDECFTVGQSTDDLDAGTAPRAPPAVPDAVAWPGALPRCRGHGASSVMAASAASAASHETSPSSGAHVGCVVSPCVVSTGSSGPPQAPHSATGWPLGRTGVCRSQ
jgi:hypothetical protein